MTEREGGSGQGRQHKVLDRAFYIGLILKGLHGVLELVGGTVLLFTRPEQLSAWVSALTQHELSEDPQDFIARSLVRFAQGLDVSATLFIAIYLLSHGLVKVVLIWAVLKNHLWAYPWLIGFLIAFTVYQCYELGVTFSWGLLALTIFDIFIVVLTWREYAIRRSQHPERHVRPDRE